MTRTVLVTGATSGIGRAAAIRFAHGGWNVVGLGRTATEIVAETDYLQMKAEDIAEAMFAIAELPAHVNVNKLEMMPVSQSLAGYQIDRGPSAFHRAEGTPMTIIIHGPDELRARAGRELGVSNWTRPSTPLPT
jgi:NAD(P)-dependent dehydrogenase (short-subunit alcohol dehydrogenase family)